MNFTRQHILRMNNTRRDFLKKAALLTGGASLWNSLPISIQKAMAISPDPGTTFYDAEHVVMLMQENRSFDHCFGTLRGVRGFNDPRAISLPGNFPVWFQPDKEGRRYPPFRLDMKDTRATWMGGVPHSWEDQVDARNAGKYDGWIEAKRPGNKDYRHMPLTMGYYTRQDIPFYYALADAFTVCDQHFCASLTGTTTNRNYFWTGKTHGEAGEKPKVRNGEMGYSKEVNWITFPERLEEAGIPWKVYQNEISLPTGVEDESLLANFTDNNLEWFSQFGVRHSAAFQAYLRKRRDEIPAEIEQLRQSSSEEKDKEIEEKKAQLKTINDVLAKWNEESFTKLSKRQKDLHRKAFTTNSGDPDYHKTELLKYQDGAEERETAIPKGDILYQFREDVNSGNLPTVSWLVAPQKFSDHPSAPWYGAWYVSEVLDILTKNPELWKKTIFILNYDENDGYFDHVPPFVAPNPHNPGSGLISQNLSVEGEFVTEKEEMKAGFDKNESRTSPVGLGFRVPLVIASPWSRGGWVNSEVCDITSTIQFLEDFLSKKTGKRIEEPNISSWRRAVSGKLTSVFRPYNGEKINFPDPLGRNEHIQDIYNASFKGLPNNFEVLQPGDPSDSRHIPQQEKGTKPSNALNYELYAEGSLDSNGKNFVIRMKAGKELFGSKSLGAPFNVYAPGMYRHAEGHKFEPVKSWAFAVSAGDEIIYKWPLKDFEGPEYHLRVYGPNGFYREFKGLKKSSGASVACKPVIQNGVCSGDLEILLKNESKKTLTIGFRENNYRENEQQFRLKPGESKSFQIATKDSKGWYDFTFSDSQGESFSQFAGRVETGAASITDPVMGS